MQITFNLDESLLNEAFKLTNLTTQEDLISLALQELVRSRSGSSGASRRKKNLLDLAGHSLPQTLITKPCAKLVMPLIATSVWVSVFRNRTGQVRQQLETLINDREVLLRHFTQLELLQGSLNEKEWTLLSTHLETQDYIELTSASWQAAARTYYDLRRRGLTVRSPIDCCIAQAALRMIYF